MKDCMDKPVEDSTGDWDGMKEIIIIEDEDGNLIAVDADDAD